MAQQRYQVIERIDAGGMAEVFKANSTSLQGFQKLVAIKRVLPSLTQNERFVRMFLDEAKVSLHLNHTNIVQVFDLGIADGTYFIVMEFVDGTNLKRIIQLLGERNQQLPPEQAVYIAMEVCKGLSHAHRKKDQDDHHLGIVHRDISPPNVLMSREGEVKITDFGLAKAKSQAEITDPGVVKGKFGYLSPEAANGEDVDARTDIFAVGIVLWEMLAGRRLFLGKTDYDTLKLVQKASIPPLSKYGVQLPHELQQILARALAQDVATRYQSAEEMGRALAGFLFRHAMVVSAFDIAHLVESVLEKKDDRTIAADVAAGQQVQRELNQLMSLEEMGNLDLFMAEHYGEIAQDSTAAADYDGDGEDPREWMDLGFGGDDFTAQAGHEPVSPPPTTQGGDSWQAGGLQDVARATQAMQAIVGPGPTQPPQQRPARPHPVRQQQFDGGAPRVDPRALADSAAQPQQHSGVPNDSRSSNTPAPASEPDGKGVKKIALIIVSLLVVAIIAAAAFLLSNWGVI